VFHFSPKLLFAVFAICFDISQGMLEMCTEMCVGLYNSLVSNFVKLHSANLGLLHIGRHVKLIAACCNFFCVNLPEMRAAVRLIFR